MIRLDNSDSSGLLLLKSPANLTCLAQTLPMILTSDLDASLSRNGVDAQALRRLVYFLPRAVEGGVIPFSRRYSTTFP